MNMPIENLKLILFFGSRARGGGRERSDADIAVLADHPLTLAEKGKIGEWAAPRINVSENKLDISDLWTASPLLQYRAAETGRLLWGERDNYLRFRVLAWKRYLDTAKFRRMREKSLAQKYD